MSYPLQFQQHAFQTFELTMRCQQGRFLLKPSPEANRRLAGVLGRALYLYGAHVKLHLVAGTSNHQHLVLQCPACQGRMRLIAHIEDPIVTARILSHLGLPTSPRDELAGEARQERGRSQLAG